MATTDGPWTSMIARVRSPRCGGLAKVPMAMSPRAAAVRLLAGTVSAFDAGARVSMRNSSRVSTRSIRTPARYRSLGEPRTAMAFLAGTIEISSNPSSDRKACPCSRRDLLELEDSLVAQLDGHRRGPDPGCTRRASWPCLRKECQYRVIPSER